MLHSNHYAVATRRFASSEITLLFPAAATATAPVAISQQAVTSLRLKSEGGEKYSFKSTNYIFFLFVIFLLFFGGIADGVVAAMS